MEIEPTLGDALKHLAVNAVLAPVAVRAMRWARVSDADHRRQPFFAR